MQIVQDVCVLAVEVERDHVFEGAAGHVFDDERVGEHEHHVDVVVFFGGALLAELEVRGDVSY